MNRLVKLSLFLAAPCLLGLALLWSWYERGERRRENQSLREAALAPYQPKRETIRSNPPTEANPESGRDEALARLEQEREELLRLRNQVDFKSYRMGYGLGDHEEVLRLRQHVRELRAQLAASNNRNFLALEDQIGRIRVPDRTPGEMFLEQNSRRADVVTLPSGLQFKVLTPGAGLVPGSNDTVMTHYHGSLIDGTVFDSSYLRGTPASFPVPALIQGWKEALQLMPVGSKWQLVIPAHLAYGERAVGPKIPANSVLLFDVELLAIEPK